MKISVESEALTTLDKKDKSGTYQLQTVYAHLVERDGSPKRYPVETEIFPNRNAAGDTIPWKKGNYEIADTSFRLDRFGRLELGFINLVPSK